MARAPLVERLGDPGFSPGKRDFPPLFEWLVGEDEERSKRAEAVLSKAGDSAADALVTFAATASVPPGRAHRVTRLLGALGGEKAREHLVLRLAEGTGKERRWAASSLAKVWPEGCEDLLLKELAKATVPEDVRAFVQPLGKVGGSRTLTAISAIRTDDAETERVIEKAKVLLTRTSTRGARVLVDAQAELPKVTVRFACREGLETVLAEELQGRAEVTATARGSVVVTHRGPLRALTSVRTALAIAFEVDAPRRPETSLPERVAELLASPDVVAIVRALAPSPEPSRFRLVLRSSEPAGAGRAAIFEVARRVAASGAPLVNDPTGSTWTMTAIVRDARISLLLEPKGVLDDRFEYRERDVPAASHPTIAAALARLTEPRADDVVWDPFCGSGTELIERAKLGPCAALFGTDLREDALDAARVNMHRAGVKATLERGDATEVALPAGLTQVLTNPPLGRRLRDERGKQEALLAGLLVRIGGALVTGGRLVWVSPTRRLDATAERAGLALERGFDVDLGGFTGRIEVRRKRQAPRMDATSATGESRTTSESPGAETS